MRLLLFAACSLACAFACGETDRACDPCRVHLTLVTTLGSDGGPGALTAAPRIAQDSRGRFYVVMPDWSQPPLVFTADGAYLQTIGRTGDGPGEYQQPRAVVVGNADTLYIFDGTNRLTVLTPAYEVVRTAIGTLRPYDAAMRSDGDLLMDVRPAGDSAIHQFDRVGERVRSFGNAPTVCPMCAAPVFSLAPGPTNDLWTVQRVREYNVAHWDSLGHATQRWTVDADWHRPVENLAMPTPETPPFAQVMGAWVDNASHLWVLGSAGALNWAEGLGPGQPGPGGRMSYRIAEYRRVYDGVIDVIDLETRTRIAHHRLADSAILVKVAPGLVASLRESEVGWWFADIYRVSLVSVDAV